MSWSVTQITRNTERPVIDRNEPYLKKKGIS